MEKVFKSVTVYGKEYKNVTAKLDANGVVIGGNIPGVGKFAADSLVAELLNGHKELGTVE